jgi:catechol 2,3-dioxygenase-like lactoylglutathione lyase family enzyme
MTFRFDHLHLRSRDAAAAARFYVEALGATELSRVGEATPSRVVLDLGGSRVFIEQAADATHPAATAPNLGLEHIGLTVPDIDAAVDDLARRGIALVSGITELRPGLRIAFFDGPDGVRIELLQRD